MAKSLCLALVVGFMAHLSTCAQVYEWFDISSSPNPGFVRQTLSTYDSQGNIYSVGIFSGQAYYTLQDPEAFLDDDLDLPGQQSSNSIIKRNADGDIIWAGNIDHFFLGEVYDLLIDSEDNLIVGGYYSGSADFDLSDNSSTLPYATQSAFVAKYNPNGELLFATALAQPLIQATSAVSTLHIDQDNNIYCSLGATGNFDLDPGSAVLEYTSSSQVGIITKLSPDGEYLFSKVGRGDFTANLFCYGINNEDGTMAVFGRGTNFQYGDPGNLIPVDIPDPNTNNLLITLTLDGELLATSYELPQNIEVRTLEQKTSGEILLLAAYDEDQEILGESNFSISALGNANYLIAYCTSAGLTTALSTLHLDQNSPFYQLVLDEGEVPYFSISFVGDIQYADEFGLQTVQSVGESDAFVGRLNDDAIFEWAFLSGGIGSDFHWSLNDYPGENEMILSTGFRQVVNFGGIVGTQVSDNFLKGLIAKVNFCEVDAESENIGACDQYELSGLLIEESTLVSTTVLNLGDCIINQTYAIEIWQSYALDSSITACEAIVFQDQTLDSTGQYMFEALSVNGCDSITTIDFNLVDLNVEISLNDGILSSTSNGEQYQWGLCSDGFDAIVGAVSSSFQPTEPGDYMLQVSSNGCSILSECLTVNETELSIDVLFKDFYIYPNPSPGYLDLQVISKDLAVSNITIFDSGGKQIDLNWQGGSRIILDNQSPGVYSLHLHTSKGLIKKTFILASD